MKSYIYSDPHPSNDPTKQQLKLEVQNNLKNTVTNPAQADLFVVLGGDGTMVRAIQALKQYNKPFFGVNCGSLGFLLNNITSVDQIPESLEGLEQITEPFLEADITTKEGEVHKVLAVNDILINFDVRKTIGIKLNHPQQETVNIIGSGAIISTPIGSTGYRLGFDGELLPIKNNDLGIIGIGTIPFKFRHMEPSLYPYTIDVETRHHSQIDIDGSYQSVENPEKMVLYPSKKTFTLLFQKELNKQSFADKRWSLYRKKKGKRI